MEKRERVSSLQLSGDHYASPLMHPGFLFLTAQADNVVLVGSSTVTVTIAVGSRADQPRFPSLLVTLLSSETNVLLASRRITQSDVSLGEFSSLARGCHK